MRQGSATCRAAGAQQSTPAYYEWKVPGQPISIQLSFEVMERLGAGVMSAFRAVPERGAEGGGVLFGRAMAEGDAITVLVEDYEAVPCEHRRGLSYVLSESDRRRLERALRKATPQRQVVGFYRSHTRPGLYLDQDDYVLVQSYFANPRQVFLLIRPQAGKPPAAGFFIWEESELRRQSTYLEFPFSRAELPERAAAVEAPAAPVRPRRTPLPRIRWRTASVAALGLLAFAALEYQVVSALSRAPGTPADGAAPALRIGRRGSYLEANWNHTAPAVLHAQRGVLSITDGLYRKDVELDAGQLRNGSVTYAPFGNDVNFRLELLGTSRRVSESVRVVTAPVAAAPSPAAGAAVQLQAVLKPRKIPQRPRHTWYDDGL